MSDAAVIIGRLAEEVRSKNTGPFWMTLDIFLRTDEEYEYLIASRVLTAERISRLYHVDPDPVQIFALPTLRAIKASFPRAVSAGSFEDRDHMLDNSTSRCRASPYGRVRIATAIR